MRKIVKNNRQACAEFYRRENNGKCKNELKKSQVSRLWGHVTAHRVEFRRSFLRQVYVFSALINLTLMSFLIEYHLFFSCFHESRSRSFRIRSLCVFCIKWTLRLLSVVKIKSQCNWMNNACSVDVVIAGNWNYNNHFIMRWMWKIKCIEV